MVGFARRAKERKDREARMRMTRACAVIPILEARLGWLTYERARRFEELSKASQQRGRNQNDVIPFPRQV